jgi:hypothetical protein
MAALLAKLFTGYGSRPMVFRFLLLGRLAL